MLELNFQLNDGREISLEAFLEAKTYAGLLIGKPDAFDFHGHPQLCLAMRETMQGGMVEQVLLARLARPNGDSVRGSREGNRFALE